MEGDQSKKVVVVVIVVGRGRKSSTQNEQNDRNFLDKNNAYCNYLIIIMTVK